MGIEATEDIFLEDTFVLSWDYSAGCLIFQVLASLLQSHPAASLPASGEWACYRPGVLTFSGVTSVHGLLLQDSVSPTTDPDGSVDYGTIDSLVQVRPGDYLIAGEFGVVTVAARDVSLVLTAT